MGQNVPIRNAGTPTAGPAAEIPDKLYFRIGEVARLCAVPAYVLRFWETEFPQLKPNKGGTGQRLYRRRDVEMALRVKRLLYDEGYTIPGARGVLKSDSKQPDSKQPDSGQPEARDIPQPALQTAAPPADSAVSLRSLRKELQEIVALLSRPAAQPPGIGLHQVRSRRHHAPTTPNGNLFDFARPDEPGPR